MKYLTSLFFVLIMCASSYGQYYYMPTPPTGGPYYAPQVIYVYPQRYYYPQPNYYQPQPYYHGYLPQYHYHYHYGWTRW